MAGLAGTGMEGAVDGGAATWALGGAGTAAGGVTGGVTRAGAAGDAG